MLLISTVIKIAALISYILLAVLTAKSDASRSVRRLFYVYLAGMIYWQFVSLMVNFSTSPGQALFWYNLLIPGTGLYSVLFFPLTRAFLGIWRQKKLTIAAYCTSVVFFAVGVSRITFDQVRMGSAGIYVPVLGTTVVYVLGAIGYFFWGAGVFNLIREAARTESSFQRNRITYLLLGSAFVILGTVSNFTPLQDYPVDITFNLINAALIAYAVIRYRLLDIRVFLTRSLLYSLVTGAVIGLYVVMVLVLGNALERSVEYTSTASGIAAVLTLALIFLPLRNRLQGFVDRLFFREKLDYQKSIESYSRAVTSIRNSGELLRLAVTTISKSVRSAKTLVLMPNAETGTFQVADHQHNVESPADLIQVKQDDQLVAWIRRSGQPLIREELKANQRLRHLVGNNPDIFDKAGISVMLPIILKDRLMGIFCLGAKLSGTMYDDGDLSFLTTLVNQTATALDNALIYMEVERRLAEQTLLFILSETFRRSMDIDEVLTSVTRILQSFLRIDHCGILYFERLGQSRSYAEHPLVKKALDLIAQARGPLFQFYQGERPESYTTAPPIYRAIESDPGLDETERRILTNQVYLPLHQRGEFFGVLMMPRRGAAGAVDGKEMELLRTIRAIVSQGVMLQRTILNLVSLKSYNENILQSIDDMGDVLIIIAPDRTISSVNRTTTKMLGYEAYDLIGKDVGILVRDGTEVFGEQGFRTLIDVGAVANLELTCVTRDGREVPVLFSGSIMQREDGSVEAFVGIARDITEHKRAEEARKNTLLIKEIHHRIKNNLQVISSLLYLQSGYIHDEQAKGMFIESQNRVRSMALIHEKLYQSKDFAGIAFDEYLTKLTESLFFSYGVNRSSVELSVDVDSRIVLGMDTAIPCGLLINELVSNALKHAFPDADQSSNGQVEVRMKIVSEHEGTSGSGQQLEITVADNGCGLAEDFDIYAGETLGLQLITTLAQQLDGQIEVRGGTGTQFVIRFTETRPVSAH